MSFERIIKELDSKEQLYQDNGGKCPEDYQNQKWFRKLAQVLKACFYMKSFFTALHDCHDEARCILTWHHANKIKLHANKSEAQITDEESSESFDEIFSSEFDQLV